MRSFADIYVFLTLAVECTANRDLLRRQQYVDIDYIGPVYEAYNISLPIDHFNASDNRTFNNRYWVNDTYYQEGGPVIWYDYGEMGITDETVYRLLGESNGTTAVMALARQYHGLALLPELRYFGYSLPFPLNISNNSNFHEPEDAPASWKYNTLAQGLQDAVYFANHLDKGDYQRDNMSALLAPNTPWIFIGGSFPGVRAANIRAGNPESYFAAWASSAPVQGSYDGSNYFNGAELSLYSNCSNDVKATVKYVDEILSGPADSEEYQRIQHLAWAGTSYLSDISGGGSYYNASEADILGPYEIAQQMAQFFRSGFQNSGAVNSTWVFCDGFETFDPKAPGSVTNDTYLSIVTNPGNATPTDAGIYATYGNNASLTLDAYFYAWTVWATFQFTVLAVTEQGRVHETADGFADATAWEYLVNTEFGWYLGSNPSNISTVSKFDNYTIQQTNTQRGTFSNATIASFPKQPDTATWNKLGGWNINPSNTMFTDGAWDPWRAGTVFSLNTDNGAPGLQPSEEVPACGKVLGDKNSRFGIVYPEAVHDPDLMELPELYGLGDDSPFARGLTLFTKALDVWLPCFGKNSSIGTRSQPESWSRV